MFGSQDVLPSEGFPAMALASSVGSPDEEWVIQGFRGHLCLLHCLSLLEPALAVPSLLLLTSELLSLPASAWCVLGTGRLPGYPSTKEKFSLPATAMLHRWGSKTTQLVHQRPKQMGSEHLWNSGQPRLLLLGQLTKRVLKEGSPSGLSS